MSTVDSRQVEGVSLTELEKRIWNDIAWAERDHEVQAKYAGQWVAICDHTIIAHGIDRDRVEQEAKEITKRPLRELAVWPICDPASMPSEISNDSLVN
jgi:hypothetical protein